LEVQIIKLPSESQVWARGKLQRRNLGISLLYSPWILSYYGESCFFGEGCE